MGAIGTCVRTTRGRRTSPRPQPRPARISCAAHDLDRQGPTRGHDLGHRGPHRAPRPLPLRAPPRPRPQPPWRSRQPRTPGDEDAGAAPDSQAQQTPPRTRPLPPQTPPQAWDRPSWAPAPDHRPRPPRTPPRSSGSRPEWTPATLLATASTTAASTTAAATATSHDHDVDGKYDHGRGGGHWITSRCLRPAPPRAARPARFPPQIPFSHAASRCPAPPSSAPTPGAPTPPRPRGCSPSRTPPGSRCSPA